MTERWLVPAESLKWSLLAARVARWAATASLANAIIGVEIYWFVLRTNDWGTIYWVALGGFFLSVGLAIGAIIVQATVARLRHWYVVPSLGTSVMAGLTFTVWGYVLLPGILWDLLLVAP
jgi:hypothetical protein